MTKKEKKLIAVIGLVVILLTACASKAANATEKIELGQKYLTEANYTEAIAAFTEVIKIDPSNIEAYMGRAEAYKGLKQYDDAKADYTEVIGKTDEMPYTQAQAYMGRAEVYELTDETTSAESDYSVAIDLLDEDDIGMKENIADTFIRELKIKVLQLHAEICIRLGLYDKALDDYAMLAELGVDMTAENQKDSSAQDESSVGGTYVWNYADENGDVTKMQLTVQVGSRQMNAIVNYPSNLDAEAIAGIIAGYTLKKEYPEIEEAYLEFQKAAEANSRLAERIDVNHVTEAQMQEAEALAAQWEALESKYGSYFQIYENEIQKWAGVDWRPQIIETVFLSNPVSRVEKTSDTLYIYVPTGTRYTKAIMDFISYSGKSESIDATDMVMEGKKNNLSQPIYEWDMSSNMIGSFKIEYREDK